MSVSVSFIQLQNRGASEALDGTKCHSSRSNKQASIMTQKEGHKFSQFVSSTRNATVLMRGRTLVLVTSWIRKWGNQQMSDLASPLTILCCCSEYYLAKISVAEIREKRQYVRKPKCSRCHLQWHHF